MSNHPLLKFCVAFVLLLGVTLFKVGLERLCGSLIDGPRPPRASAPPSRPAGRPVAPATRSQRPRITWSTSRGKGTTRPRTAVCRMPDRPRSTGRAALPPAPRPRSFAPARPTRTPHIRFTQTRFTQTRFTQTRFTGVRPRR